MAACTASSFTMRSASYALVLLALGPAFSNFLNKSSTILWSFFSSVIASIGDGFPHRRDRKRSRAGLLGDAALGQGQHIERLVELGVAHESLLEHELADRPAALG